MCGSNTLITAWSTHRPCLDILTLGRTPPCYRAYREFWYAAGAIDCQPWSREERVSFRECITGPALKADTTRNAGSNTCLQKAHQVPRISQAVLREGGGM